MRRNSRSALLKIRDIAKSRGAKLYRKHAIHKPGNVLGLHDHRPQRIKRMLKVLRERGWKIEFRVEAVSARGFRYTALASTWEEAFLQAMGVWRQDLATFLPKVPEIAAKIVPVKTKAYVADVVRELMENLPKVRAPEEDYRRIYMRVWRAKKRRERSELEMVAA